MINKRLKIIAKNNKSISIHKIEEVQRYIKSLEPIVRKEPYGIGVLPVVQKQHTFVLDSKKLNIFTSNAFENSKPLPPAC